MRQTPLCRGRSAGAGTHHLVGGGCLRAGGVGLLAAQQLQAAPLLLHGAALVALHAVDLLLHAHLHLRLVGKHGALRPLLGRRAQPRGQIPLHGAGSNPIRPCCIPLQGAALPRGKESHPQSPGGSQLGVRCRTTQRLFPPPSPHGTGEQSSTTAAEEPPQPAQHGPPSPQPLAKGRALDPSPLAMPPALLLSMLPAGTTSSSGGDLVRGGTMPTAGQRNTRLSIPGDGGQGPSHVRCWGRAGDRCADISPWPGQAWGACWSRTCRASTVPLLRAACFSASCSCLPGGPSVGAVGADARCVSFLLCSKLGLGCGGKRGPR